MTFTRNRRLMLHFIPPAVDVSISVSIAICILLSLVPPLWFFHFKLLLERRKWWNKLIYIISTLKTNKQTTTTKPPQPLPYILDNFLQCAHLKRQSQQRNKKTNGQRNKSRFGFVQKRSKPEFFFQKVDLLSLLLLRKLSSPLPSSVRKPNFY